MKDFVPYQPINGHLSANVTMTMSGISYQNWVQSLSGKSVVEINKIFIEPFNISLLSSSLKQLRSVTSLNNVLRSTFDRGIGRLANLRGAASFENGVIRLDHINFRGIETIGDATGSIDLTKWNMDLTARFGLIALTQSNYPHLVLRFSGDMDEPSRYTDSREIESYLARQLR